MSLIEPGLVMTCRLVGRFASDRACIQTIWRSGTWRSWLAWMSASNRKSRDVKFDYTSQVS